MSTQMDTYRHLDIGDPIVVKLSFEEVARRIVEMNHGCHRLLSQLVHARRKKYGENDVMAREIERLLNQGMNDYEDCVPGRLALTANQMIVLLDIYRGGSAEAGLHAGTLNEDVRYLERRMLVQTCDDGWETTDFGTMFVHERLGKA